MPDKLGFLALVSSNNILLYITATLLQFVDNTSVRLTL